MPTTWVMACAYGPTGNLVACGSVYLIFNLIFSQLKGQLKAFFLSISGLDNKVTVYPLNVEEDVTTKKKNVGTHTSYMSCCLFPGTDQQVFSHFQ